MHGRNLLAIEIYMVIEGIPPPFSRRNDKKETSAVRVQLFPQIRTGDGYVSYNIVQHSSTLTVATKNDLFYYQMSEGI